MANRFLIFSLALNGYQWTYRHYLETHRRYATRLGAEYISVTKPYISKLGVECCWLKLHLLREALNSGYDQILFLDADTWVAESAPDIRENIKPEKFIYMAKSYTQRYNSGVMLVVNHELALGFISQVIANRLKKLAIEDDVGWGENGHIIHCAKTSNIVSEINQRWNNTYQPELQDYIRHHNHGPFRQSFTLKALHKVLACMSRVICKLNKLIHPQQGKKLPSNWFRVECQNILSIYPLFSQR